MKILFDLATIVLFFILYKLYGMNPAIISAMVAYSIQTLFLLIKNRQVDKMQWISLLLIVGLGAASLLLHNEQIFKWKPTAIYGLFALVFASSHFWGKKVVLEHLLDTQVKCDPAILRKLNMSWCGFFIVMALVNLYVAYYFSTDFWVNFKLFGILGMTVLFIVIQAFYLAKHTHDEHR